MATSFSKFLLEFQDDWNISLPTLAVELYVNYNTLLDWIYKGKIPTGENLEAIKRYFGGLDDIEFDRKVYKRMVKVTAPNGVRSLYRTVLETSTQTPISVSVFNKYKNTDKAIPDGRAKGYRIDYEYMEVN